MDSFLDRSEKSFSDRGLVQLNLGRFRGISVFDSVFDEALNSKGVV